MLGNMYQLIVSIFRNEIEQYGVVSDSRSAYQKTPDPSGSDLLDCMLSKTAAASLAVATDLETLSSCPLLQEREAVSVTANQPTWTSWVLQALTACWL